MNSIVTPIYKNKNKEKGIFEFGVCLDPPHFKFWFSFQDNRRSLDAFLCHSVRLRLFIEIWFGNSFETSKVSYQAIS